MSCQRAALMKTSISDSVTQHYDIYIRVLQEHWFYNSLNDMMLDHLTPIHL